MDDQPSTHPVTATQRRVALARVARSRASAAGGGATIGAIVGSLVGGPIGAAIGGALGAAAGVGVHELRAERARGTHDRS